MPTPLFVSIRDLYPPPLFVSIRDLCPHRFSQLSAGNRSSQKGKPCLVCQNAEVTEVKYLLEEIKKMKDEIEVYPFPQPKPTKPPRGSDNEPHCWNCYEKIVKLPWLRCPKCNGYICQSCGECLCGFGFKMGEERNEEQGQP